MKNLTTEETRLYFALYVLLTWVAVVWAGTLAIVAEARYPRHIERHSQDVVPSVPASQPIPQSPPRKAGASIPDMILGAAHLCGVPPGEFYRLVVRESSMNHWGKDGRVLRSHSNAYGLAQVKIGTARLVSRTLNVMKPWDNLVAGACYYRQMLDRFGGDSHRALVAYHNGPNGGRTPHAVRYANDILGSK